MEIDVKVCEATLKLMACNLEKEKDKMREYLKGYGVEFSDKDWKLPQGALVNRMLAKCVGNER